MFLAIAPDYLRQPSIIIPPLKLSQRYHKARQCFRCRRRTVG